MIPNGELNASEVRRILKGYWWILPITIICGLTLALGAALFLPKKFTSQTLVLVDQQTMSADLVKPVITEATSQRLASMQAQILSSSKLQQLIEKFGLYASDRDSVHMEDLVLRLRAAIEVTPLEAMMQGTGNRQLPGFHINVTMDNPQVAQRICSELTTMFLEQSSKEAGTSSVEATKFLAEHVDDAKRNLDEQDAKLADFKKKYMGSLPDDEQRNLGLLAGMNAQLDAITQNVSRAQQDRVMNESLLNAQLASWKAVKGGDTPSETLDQQLATLQDQLSSLQSRYTADHPDVIKTKHQIEQLKKRIADGPKGESAASSTQANMVEPVSIQQLRAKMRQDDLNIADLVKRQGQTQGQIGALQGRLQSSPAVEQQYKELTRNYQTALDGYNDLLKKHDASAIAGDLIREQQGEQLRVLDAASLPLTPSFPKKPVFAGAGAGGGLALGLAILYLIAALDVSMHTERDVEACMQLPVLASLPNVAPAGKHKPKGISPGLRITETGA
jgi:polysaccharide chain length determinant protein (PEP-CTERM system associated)